MPEHAQARIHDIEEDQERPSLHETADELPPAFDAADGDHDQEEKDERCHLHARPVQRQEGHIEDLAEGETFRLHGVAKKLASRTDELTGSLTRPRRVRVLEMASLSTLFSSIVSQGQHPGCSRQAAAQAGRGTVADESSPRKRATKGQRGFARNSARVPVWTMRPPSITARNRPAPLPRRGCG